MEQSKGLGDSVHKVLKVTGVNKIVKTVVGKENCTPCQKRRDLLNEKFPYKKT